MNYPNAMEIDLSKPAPAYEQIVQQISESILSGSLNPGDHLPSIRQLASDLDLNPNTVAKAYKKLEDNRVIQTAGRKGTFIRVNAARYIVQKSTRDAEFELEELITSFHKRGLSHSFIKDLLKRQLHVTTA